MRIVSGSAGGRTIEAPEGADVRPTLERVREAIFNSLFSHGLIDGCRFVDLFAGSGALGLEALSRGAEHCVFVDASRSSVAAVERNLRTLGFTERALVRIGDAFTVLGSVGSADVVLCDPPYAFDRWEELFEAIARVPDLAAVVVESGHEIVPGPGWEILKSKRYGSTVVSIARRSDGAAEGEGLTA